MVFVVIVEGDLVVACVVAHLVDLVEAPPEHETTLSVLRLVVRTVLTVVKGQLSVFVDVATIVDCVVMNWVDVR